MYNLSTDNKKVTATNDPEYSRIDQIFGCDLDKEWFLVHGHLPFGIPYSSEVTYDNKVFKRICVDVSNDGDYSGISNGSDKRALKNWAYVTFTENTDKELSITAVGRNQGNMYYISDMRNLQFKAGTNYEAVGFNPYMGLKKDTLNVMGLVKNEGQSEKNCEKLFTKYAEYDAADTITNTDLIRLKKCIPPIIRIPPSDEHLISKYHHKFDPTSSEESIHNNDSPRYPHAIVQPPMIRPIPPVSAEAPQSGGKRKKPRSKKSK